MPQGDATSGSAVGGASQVACEAVSGEEATVHLEYAPESFWLSKDAELDWLDQNAFIERKDSGKAHNSHSLNLNLNSNTASSNRYSGNLKASIIGLPKPNYAEARNRRACKVKTGTIRLFTKRCGSGRNEPTSPKVSCMGKVRSRKERSRSRRKGGNEAAADSEFRQNKKAGFWKSVGSVFMFRSKAENFKQKEEIQQEGMTKKSKSKKQKAFVPAPAPAPAPAPPAPASAPGLGGVTRFSSGRRSGAWAGDLANETV